LNSFELEVRRNNVFFPFAVDFLSKVDIDENFYVEDELFDEFLDSILEKILNLLTKSWRIPNPG